MLNTIGAARTNTYQHLAVDKSRLHIPCFFADNVLFMAIAPFIQFLLAWLPVGIRPRSPDLDHMSCEGGQHHESTSGIHDGPDPTGSQAKRNWIMVR